MWKLCTGSTVNKSRLINYSKKYRLPISGNKIDLCVRLYQLAIMSDTLDDDNDVNDTYDNDSDDDDDDD